MSALAPRCHGVSNSVLPSALQRKRARRFHLLLTTAIIVASACVATQASAQSLPSGCSSTGIGTGTATITCGPSGNIYGNGIVVDNVDDLTMVIQSGVNVDSSTHAVVVGAGTNDVILTIQSDVQISSSGNFTQGISISNAGDVTLYFGGTIDMGYSARNVIYIKNATGNVDATLAGTITTQGSHSDGFTAGWYVGGNIEVTQSGSITTQGNFSDGVFFDGVYGHAAFELQSSGSIKTYGDLAHGVFIYGTGDGDYDDHAYVKIDGDITTSGVGAHGVYIRETTGDVVVTRPSLSTACCSGRSPGDPRITSGD